MTRYDTTTDAPPAWDRLADRPVDRVPGGEGDVAETGAATRRGGLVLASLADLVTILAFCAATLAAVRGAGFRPGLTVIPWAGALAVGWWLTSAATLVSVRRGTPGLLISGLTFSQPVPRERLASTLLTTLASACLLGIPVALLGGGRSVVEIAAGSAVVGAPPEGARTG
jgi:hypothetical protein